MTLVAKHGSKDVGAPTTLDRIDLCLAKRLILRGYLNTYLLTLFLAPLNDGDLSRLKDLEHRIDDIVGRSKPCETEAADKPAPMTAVSHSLDEDQQL